MQKHEMFINGQWVGDDLEQIDVVNPATNEVIATVPKGGAGEAKRAVDAAAQALDKWGKKTAEERSAYLFKWHELINQEKEIIGKIMTKEQGKPLKEAIGEIDYANGFIS